MGLLNRDTLKNFFRNGSMPTEGAFGNLIDSTVNKVDDGFSKDQEHGLMLSPEGSSQKLLSFYENIAQKSPAWHIELKTDETAKGLSISEGKDVNESRLFLENGGNVGIGTTAPQQRLDVNGMVAMKGRVGTAYASEIPADGKWYSIVSGLNHSHAFEVIARVGEKGSGRHAMLQAIALSTYGSSEHRVQHNHAHYSFWRPCKIKLKWEGTTFDYGLKMKSTHNFGKGVAVKFFITRLWGDEELGYNYKEQSAVAKDDPENPESETSGKTTG